MGVRTEKDEPVQEELFEPMTKLEGKNRYRLPKYPPSHLGKNWVKPRSWGQVIGQPTVLVAFPEEWLPGRPVTELRELMLKPGCVTISLERGGLVEAETLMSLRIVAPKKEALSRSLHGG